MSQIVSLISNPAEPAVDADLIGLVGAVLPASWELDVLDTGIAAELTVDIADGTDPQELAAALREVVAQTSRPVDVNVLPPGNRRKRLFIADMDSTMIGQECIDELADLVGLKAEVSAITERAMRGEIAFEPALRERVALLKGLPTSVVDKLLAERITLTPGGQVLVATMRANGAYTALISGGFTLFTSRVAAMIGFEENRGNTLEVEGEAFTGTVAEPILGREAKRATLEELRTRLALPREETLAVGDGANDLAMLGEAGLGVAYRAKPAVAAAAKARLDHADLTGLLYLQGYYGHDFVR